jgi:hypothetical protein
MNRLRQIAVGAACAAALTLPMLGAGAAQATTTLTPLTLMNGWTLYSGSSLPSVTTVAGIVHFKGAITTSGTNPVAFTLPAADRPDSTVYVPVDMCYATNGRLDIAPSGVVTVQAESDFSNAACFTSLDGASFAKSASSFTPLTPVNGWSNFGDGTASPAVRNIGGIIHLEGAIGTNGTSAIPFILPAADRPANTVYVKVDLCDATNGRLEIQSDGTVYVEPEDGDFSNAACFYLAGRGLVREVGELVHAAHDDERLARLRLRHRPGRGGGRLGNRHPQGRHRDLGHQRGSVRPAGGLPPDPPRHRAGGPLRRHQRGAAHRARRWGRGGGREQLRQRGVLHLAGRGLVHAVTRLVATVTPVAKVAMDDGRAA